MSSDYYRFFVVSIIAALILAVVPFIVDAYVLHMLNLIGITAILVMSLNLIVGYTGLLSFGHVGLFAVGAYTSALLAKLAGLPVWVSMPIGAVVAGIVGLIVGLISLRFKLHFFAIVTLSFAEIIRLVAYNSDKLTGGSEGLHNIPLPENFLWLDFTQRLHFYFFILIAVMLTIALTYYLVHSRLGRAMITIRENEMFAQFIGVNVWKTKIIAFFISAIIAGFAGSIYSHYVLYISPFDFSIVHSVTYLLMVIIGGSGTIIGPILGTAFLTLLPEYLRGIEEYRMILFGGLLTLSILFLRGGLVGAAKNLTDYLKSARFIKEVKKGEKYDVGS